MRIVLCAFAYFKYVLDLEDIIVRDGSSIH